MKALCICLAAWMRSDSGGDPLHGDGNGWTRCDQGHRHWGRNGAAGLLLRQAAGAAAVVVLMQHRAGWTSDGDTWGLPGGARDSHETWVVAALREAAEEAGIDAGALSVVGESTDDHGGWAYVTVVADAIKPLTLTPNAESAELRWVPRDGVAALNLHPGFARSWPRLQSDFLS
jgi:8-oxo-dGTP diphosphatase